ncbi:hypothetical protein IY145_11830 [Methylosinus sp. H3A]|uniref:hypothetical protein n=1 Tax=Methylosinus sp. H3A TaxID=2785786 RepID=UPI0018C21834|nr:hypothetical protein [Methylosinus sp. H3A]MBG0810067.1 hypothetical protein [Methylosinus sp. H3A]
MTVFLMKPTQRHPTGGQLFKVLVSVNAFVGRADRFHVNASYFAGIRRQRLSNVN